MESKIFETIDKTKSHSAYKAVKECQKSILQSK